MSVDTGVRNRSLESRKSRRRWRLGLASLGLLGIILIVQSREDLERQGCLIFGKGEPDEWLHKCSEKWDVWSISREVCTENPAEMTPNVLIVLPLSSELLSEEVSGGNKPSNPGDCRANKAGRQCEESVADGPAGRITLIDQSFSERGLPEGHRLESPTPQARGSVENQQFGTFAGSMVHGTRMLLLAKELGVEDVVPLKLSKTGLKKGTAGSLTKVTTACDLVASLERASELTPRVIVLPYVVKNKPYVAQGFYKYIATKLSKSGKLFVIAEPDWRYQPHLLPFGLTSETNVVVPSRDIKRVNYQADPPYHRIRDIDLGGHARRVHRGRKCCLADGGSAESVEAGTMLAMLDPDREKRWQEVINCWLGTGSPRGNARSRSNRIVNMSKAKTCLQENKGETCQCKKGRLCLTDWSNPDRDCDDIPDIYDSKPSSPSNQ